MRLIAVTREPSSTLAECELTFVARTPIDVDLARRQHAAYRDTLVSLGLEVLHLPAREEWPDAVFVEDAAVVLDEVAVITRPGAASRAEEGTALAEALRDFRPLRELTTPATLDGGDVLRVDRTLYVGRSARTNQAGRQQLNEIVQPFGYEVVPVEMRDCLHLKTALSAVAPGLVLADPKRVDTSAVRDVRCLAVPEGERDAVDALAVAGVVILAAGYPRTSDLLRGEGCNVVEVDLSEFAKAEGGPTCLSVIFAAERVTSGSRSTHQSHT
jgi:dimethylargininase